MAKFYIFFMLSFLFCQTVYAQTGLSGAVDDSFQKDYRNVPYPRDNNTDIIKEKDITEKLPKSANASTVFVQSFIFTGNRVIDKEELEETVASYCGRDLTITELNAAADKITALYRDNGYIISHAYIPPQIVDNGVIKIAILEGEIGAVTVEGQSDYKKEFIDKHLTDLISGIVLDVSDLERSLLILNSYMDLEARAAIKPGEKPGTSDIIVYVKDRNPYRATFALDNYGTEETSLYRLNAAASVGNIIASGDKLSAYFAVGIDNLNLKDLLFEKIDYMLPLGGDGFKVGAAYVGSRYRATGDFELLDLNGYSNEFQVNAEYPLILKTSWTANLTGQFKRKDTMDKILGERNTADGIYALSAGLYGVLFPWSSGAGWYVLSLEQGINPLFRGSHNSAGSSRPDAGGLFEKIYGEVDFSQHIYSSIRMNFALSGQYASEEMLAPEKFYIGGIYSVRGFKSGANSGDHGYRISIEAETDVHMPQIKALIFCDRGWVKNISFQRGGYSVAYMNSLGVGLRIYPIKGLSLKADYGLPVSASREDVGAGIFYARISYDF